MYIVQYIMKVVDRKPTSSILIPRDWGKWLVYNIIIGKGKINTYLKLASRLYPIGLIFGVLFLPQTFDENVIINMFI